MGIFPGVGLDVQGQRICCLNLTADLSSRVILDLVGCLTFLLRKTARIRVHPLFGLRQLLKPLAKNQCVDAHTPS